MYILSCVWLGDIALSGRYPPRHPAWAVLATYRIFMQYVHQAGHMLLPTFATSSSFCLVIYSPLSRVPDQTFSFPSAWVFLPASLQCPCTPSLLSSVPFVCIPFILKIGIGADTRLPVPCSTELAVWKEKAALPSGSKTEFNVYLSFKYASERGWSEEQKVFGFWVLDVEQSSASRCAPHRTQKPLGTEEFGSRRHGWDSGTPRKEGRKVWVLVSASHLLFLLQFLPHPVRFMHFFFLKPWRIPKYITEVYISVVGCSLPRASKRLMTDHHAATVRRWAGISQFHVLITASAMTR